MQGKTRPFIIWTFRRSGGTNLGQALFKASNYKSVEHEPFNQDRIFGHIIINWNKNKDIEALYISIDRILKDKILIKHCLELMPNEINQAILKISIKYGYKHLFLYREEAKNRLLSLNYSLKTNIWGKKHLKIRSFNKRVFTEDIQIERLLQHEKQCRSKMLSIFETMVQLDVKPLSVSFEQVYKSDMNYSSLLIKLLFKSLIGNTNAVTIDFLNRTLKGGSQGTNEDYVRFPNSHQFIVELDKIKKFKLQKSIEIKYEISDELKAKHCEIWEALPSVKLDEYHLQGTCLVDEPYKISIDGKSLQLEKGLKSDRVAKKFSKNEQAAKCGFISEAFINNNDIPLVIEPKIYIFEDFLDCKPADAVRVLQDTLAAKEFVVLNPVTKAKTFSRISFSNGYSHCILFSDEQKDNEWVMIQEMHCLAQGYYHKGNIVFPLGNPSHSNTLLDFIEDKLKTTTYKASSKKIHGILLSSGRPHHFFFDQYIHLLTDLNSRQFLDSTYIDKYCYIDHLKDNQFKQAIQSSCYIRPLLGSYNSNLPISYANQLRKNLAPHKTIKIPKDNEITLWFGLSGIKRSWLGQISGCVEIVNELSKHFKSIRLIFDGISSFHNTVKDVPKESLIFNEIQELLKSNSSVTETTSVIGLDYLTKIKIGSRSDAFIAMDGAGLITPLVFLNLPGVIHGIGVLNNYSTLYQGNDRVKYVNSNNINDANKNKPSVLKSYDIDWKVLFNALMPVLDLNVKVLITSQSDKKNSVLTLKSKLNDKPGDVLREISLWFEESGDTRTALILMQKALEYKPEGQFIQEKVTEYKLLLGSK